MTDAKDVYLVRHVQAEGKGKVLGARSDPPATPLGLLQATALLDYFQRVHLDTVLSSDLQRAVSTTPPLAARCGRVPKWLPALREMDYGDWDGLTHEEIEARWPGELQGFRSGYCAHKQPPGGEDLYRAHARFTEALEFELTERPGTGVALVSHKLVLRMFIAYQLGMPLGAWRYIPCDRASVTHLRFRPDVAESNTNLPKSQMRWEVRSVNETWHLRFLPPDEG